jgi:hypothetical protein
MVRESGVSLAWPVKAVSGVWPSPLNPPKSPLPYLSTLAFYKAQGIIHLYTFCSSASAAQEPTVRGNAEHWRAWDHILILWKHCLAFLAYVEVAFPSFRKLVKLRVTKLE